MKVAKLVYVTLVTRVVVEEDAAEQEIMELAIPRLSEKLMDEPFENIEKIVDDIECPYDEFWDVKYVDKNGTSIYLNSPYNSNVLAPEPNDSDLHCCSFEGWVNGFRNGNVIVEDADGDCYEIEPNRLEVL